MKKRLKGLDRTSISRDVVWRHLILEEPQSKIAHDLGLTFSMVSRLVKYAWDNDIITQRIDREHGEITIRVTSGPSGVVHQGIRQPGLEGQLRGLFPLEEAVVVSIPPVEGTDQEQDDATHRAVGSAAARYLRHLLREFDHIGIGGGRGPAYTVDELLRLSPILPHEQIKLTSLAGNMYTLDWTGSGRSLDADDTVIQLSRCFKQAEVVKLGLPVVYEDAGTFLDEALPPEDGHQASPLLSAKWQEEFNERERGNPHLNQIIPNVAIVGIGSLAGGHRFLRRTHLLAPIQDQLERLKEATKQLETMAEGYYPIADICNYLIQAADPLGRVSRKLTSDLDPLIADINRRILGVRPRHLRMVRDYVVAVAGGRYKRCAIWTVLSLDPPIIRNLVTDQETAEWLIDQKIRRAGR